MNGRSRRARGGCSVSAQTKVQVRARMLRAEVLAAWVTANGGSGSRR